MRETRAGHHDDVGGAGRMKARCVLMNITDLAKVGARDPSRFSRAPFRTSEIAVNEAPRVQATKTPPKDRPASRSFAPSERNVLATHPCAIRINLNVMRRSMSNYKKDLY
jgi:hypothetical protein